MSLLSSIQMANNALRANQVGLQVVGQNISNANTPGYIREEISLQPAPTQRIGNLLLGLGVDVKAVVQKIDLFLEERLRGAVSDRTSSETQDQTFKQLEGLIGELGKNDLSTSLNGFFSSISEILNQPESASVRNMAVLKGQSLAGDVVRMANRLTGHRTDLNDRVVELSAEANRLIDEISTLNVRIAETEGGDTSASDAVGLRDQRYGALESLAQLVNIRVMEQPSGVVTVFTGGDFLVIQGATHHIKVASENDRGISVANLRIEETDSPLEATSGELAGLVIARDQILGGFLDRLDTFAGTLAGEFNKVFSSGQGLNGYQKTTSEFGVDAPDAALDAAGLKFTPVNGSFQLQVYNKRTKLTQTTDVRVDLNGLDDDTTLSDLAARLDAIDGISAGVTISDKLEISSDSPDQEFAFANDTSGVLAALGVNTFFTGTDSSSLGVSDAIAEDPAKFAASRSGIGGDTANAIEMASFIDRPLESHNGATLSVLYDRLTGEATQGSTVTHSVAEGFRAFEETLRGQKLAISGVSLDEEAVRMIQYQRGFQANAKYIATLSELLGILANL
ncbi:MAG: flagellar hook-associated protein FlgK [Pirellulales bacterium]